MTDTNTIAARLRDVVFSYDRDESLPDTESLTSDEQFDPDDRTGAVLRGVDMDVPAGSFTVIMGASGGGKSTLLRTFNSIIPDFITGAFDGEVDVLGQDATETRVSEMASTVGMVLQDYESQLFGTSIDAEVAFGPENLGVAPEEIDNRIDAALALVGLHDLDRHREPAGLSGGQKQRLVFASVSAMHPRLLVLDEPTSDLDPAGTRELLSAVERLAGIGTAGEDDHSTAASPPLTGDGSGWSGPETIVMVTHKIEEALLADHAVLLKNGQVFRDGPAREVFTDTDALEDSRVAVPPLVEAFTQLDIGETEPPLTPTEAVEVATEHDLTWTPPAADSSEPVAPAGTGGDVGETCFELTDVVFEYDTDRGPIRAVDEVSMTIRHGEALAIVGHNGSGKTTLAKHLNGLHEPGSGRVQYNGQEVSDYSMSAIGRDVGYVFQNPDHQIFSDTVREEVAFGPENFGLEGDELDQRVQAAIESVELDGLEESDPFTLSKGQRQRVALAGILATSPEVIVFDEPTTGLDATQQRQFMELVGELNRDDGVTIVMVTHSMDTVAQYAPRTAVMRDGRIVYDGATRELFSRSDLLEANDLQPPHVVETSVRIADAVGSELTHPALSVDELIAGLREERR
jgi:energy-coupling factor transport system ATP-binding protein